MNSAVRAIGEIKEIGEGKFLLKVAEDLVLRVFGDPGKYKAGAKIQVIGELEPAEQGREVNVLNATVEKAAKDAEYVAETKTIAKVFRSHSHLSRKSGRAAFGFGTLVWGPNKPGEGKFLSYGAFDPLSSELAFGRRDPQGNLETPPARQGAIMRLIGTLRRRYFTSGGKPGNRIEVLASDGLTEVIKAAEYHDPFADTAFADMESAIAEEASDEVPF